MTDRHVPSNAVPVATLVLIVEGGNLDAGAYLADARRTNSNETAVVDTIGA